VAKFALFRNTENSLAAMLTQFQFSLVSPRHSHTGQEIHRRVSLGSLAARFGGNAPAC
jgi:hypothetical protein